MNVPGFGETVIVLRTRHHALTALTASGYPTLVAIDGVTSKLPWGEHMFQVSPGLHDVSVSLGSILGVQMGQASIEIEVAKGHSAHLEYRAPFNYLMEGNIKFIR